MLRCTQYAHHPGKGGRQAEGCRVWQGCYASGDPRWARRPAEDGLDGREASRPGVVVAAEDAGWLVVVMNNEDAGQSGVITAVEEAGRPRVIAGSRRSAGRR